MSFNRWMAKLSYPEQWQKDKLLKKKGQTTDTYNNLDGIQGPYAVGGKLLSKEYILYNAISII